MFVYKLVVQRSIEERMLEPGIRKAALAQEVLGHDAEGAGNQQANCAYAGAEQPANNPLGLPR